jgi:hypothetical protein
MYYDMKYTLKCNVYCTVMQEDELMGDMDLFVLSPNASALTVNGKWLQHLQERTLGEDSYPHKARGEEDPHRCMCEVLQVVWTPSSRGCAYSAASYAPQRANHGGASKHDLSSYPRVVGLQTPCHHPE